MGNRPPRRAIGISIDPLRLDRLAKADDLIAPAATVSALPPGLNPYHHAYEPSSSSESLSSSIPMRRGRPSRSGILFAGGGVGGDDGVAGRADDARPATSSESR